ncbi:hypothetical protein EYF80_012532 [Liparis tanakae]|uniref:Uncharacterized protein n=1 Tax=Liparis tanakae TaxID=230148 RepID=A0A4Z2IHQ3_9TELE|nr:hypothetical protein EYF80_012532 [Liparis tanakae]
MTWHPRVLWGLAISTAMARYGCVGYLLLAESLSGLMLKGSRRSLSGSMLLRRSISGTVWSMPIWMRRRIMDISLTFWICSAYLA